MTNPFSSQDERDAFRESLPASDTFVVPTSEVRMLLNALDAAERALAAGPVEVTIERNALPPSMANVRGLFWPEAYSVTCGAVTVGCVEPDDVNGYERLCEALGARVVRR